MQLFEHIDFKMLKQKIQTKHLLVKMYFFDLKTLKIGFKGMGHLLRGNWIPKKFQKFVLFGSLKMILFHVKE